MKVTAKLMMTTKMKLTGHFKIWKVGWHMCLYCLVFKHALNTHIKQVDQLLDQLFSFQLAIQFRAIQEKY
jgi:hypothetical protein